MEARKAWVPVTVQALTPELAREARRRRAAGRAGDAGARRAAPRQPGCEVGDMIIAVDGDPVEASQPSDADVFDTMIRQYKIGSTVTLTTVRGKEERPVKVQLESSPRLPREMKKYEDPNFEFRVRDVAEMDRARARRARPARRACSSKRSAKADGPRSRTSRDGDVILAIDGEPCRRRRGAAEEDGSDRGGEAVVGRPARAARVPDVLRRDADGMGLRRGCGGCAECRVREWSRCEIRSRRRSAGRCCCAALVAVPCRRRISARRCARSRRSGRTRSSTSACRSRCGCRWAAARCSRWTTPSRRWRR